MYVVLIKALAQHPEELEDLIEEQLAKKGGGLEAHQLWELIPRVRKTYLILEKSVCGNFVSLIVQVEAMTMEEIREVTGIDNPLKAAFHYLVHHRPELPFIKVGGNGKSQNIEPNVCSNPHIGLFLFIRLHADACSRKGWEK